MRIARRILAAVLACSMLLGNVVYATEFSETEAPALECEEEVTCDFAQEPAEPAAPEAAEIPVQEPTAEIAEIVEDIPEEPVADVEAIPAEEPAEEIAEIPAEEPVEEIAEEPAEEIAEVPAEEPAEEIAEVPSEEPAEIPAEEPAEEIAEVPVEEAAEDDFTAVCSAMFDTLAAPDDAMESGKPIEADEVKAAAAEDKVISIDMLAAEQKQLDKTITVAQMLEYLSNPTGEPEKYQICMNLAAAFNLGQDEAEIRNILQQMQDDYIRWQENYEKYQADPTAFAEPVAVPVEPRIEFDGTNISLSKHIEDVLITENKNGTFSKVELGTGFDKETIHAAMTELVVTSDASMTLVYEGDTKITQTVRKDNPTDFVITLDCSSSMAKDGRYEAMRSALGVLLSQIFADKDNTVSIVCWATSAAVIEVNGTDRFSAEGDISIEQILDALAAPTGWFTYPETGLTTAESLLEKFAKSETPDSPDRNKGVLMFTDGIANGFNSDGKTVVREEKLFQKYNATIVNVSIGDEADVRQYETYLNPSSEKYQYNKLGAAYTTGPDAQQNREKLQEKVVYYNIPKLTDQELAQRVTEMFDTAFTDIVSEEKELQTTVITEGVLAAIGAKLIDEIPAGFEVAQSAYLDNPVIRGVDQDGNTLIEFPVSGSTMTYFVFPEDGATFEKNNASFSEHEAVLIAQPLTTTSTSYSYSFYVASADLPATETPKQQVEIQAGKYRERKGHSESFDKWCHENFNGRCWVELTREERLDAVESYFRDCPDASMESVIVTITGDNAALLYVKENGRTPVFDILQKITSSPGYVAAEIFANLLDKSPRIFSLTMNLTLVDTFVFVGTALTDYRDTPEAAVEKLGEFMDSMLFTGAINGVLINMFNAVKTIVETDAWYMLLTGELPIMDPLALVMYIMYAEPVRKESARAAEVLKSAKTEYANHHGRVPAEILGIVPSENTSNDPNSSREQCAHRWNLLWHSNGDLACPEGPTVLEVLDAFEKIGNLSEEDQKPFLTDGTAENAFVRFLLDYLDWRTAYEFEDVFAALEAVK